MAARLGASALPAPLFVTRPWIVCLRYTLSELITHDAFCPASAEHAKCMGKGEGAHIEARGVHDAVLAPAWAAVLLIARAGLYSVSVSLRRPGRMVN